MTVIGGSMHQETWRLCTQLRTRATHEVVDGVVVHVPEDRAAGERVVVAVEGVRHVDAPPCTACVGSGEPAVGVEDAVVEKPVIHDVARLVML